MPFRTDGSLHHGFLHAWPLRASISSDSSGPQVPGGIVREIRWMPFAIVEDRLHRRPTRFHHVLTRVQRRVADHRVHQQRFICRWRSRAEARAVVEVHRDGAQPHAFAGMLRQKAQRNSFFRLNAEDQQIRRGWRSPCRLRCLKRRMRRGVELDRDSVTRFGSRLPLRM